MTAQQDILDRARELRFLGSMPFSEQLDHAAGFVDAWRHSFDDAPPVERIVDLGSGGGMPILVVGEHFPDAELILVERGERRAEFLDWAMQTLGWDTRAQVVCAEAEVAGRDPELRATAQLVTARSFAPPAVTAECAAGFLVADGRLVVSEPPEPDPLRWQVDGLAELGMVPFERHTIASGSYRVVRQATVCADRYPRRAGTTRKRPLY